MNTSKRQSVIIVAIRLLFMLILLLWLASEVF